MTLPPPDARSPRPMPRRPHIIPPDHSMPEKPPVFPDTVFPQPSILRAPEHGSIEKSDHEHAIDIATHSWDLATGGLKTLTAKRELPLRVDRRTSNVVPDILATSRSYLFILVILLCVMLMLIGGGIVLFVMTQP